MRTTLSQKLDYLKLVFYLAISVTWFMSWEIELEKLEGFSLPERITRGEYFFKYLKTFMVLWVIAKIVFWKNEILTDYFIYSVDYAFFKIRN